MLGKEFSIEDIERNIKLTAGFAVNMAVCRKYRKLIIILLRNNGASLGIARQKHFAGNGGVTYSQPFELRYSGRVNKPVPDWALWIFRTEPGQKFMKFYHSRTFALGAFVAEKIRIFIEDKIKK